MRLFPEEERPGYAVDACSVIAISENYGAAQAEAVWAVLTALVEDGRLKTVRLVMEEVRRNDPAAFRRLSVLRARLVVRDHELLRAVGPITQQFQRMSRPWSTRPKADPWLVALARVQSLTVVTEEANRPGKIPHACQQLGISVCTLAELLSAVEGNS